MMPPIMYPQQHHHHHHAGLASPRYMPQQQSWLMSPSGVQHAPWGRRSVGGVSAGGGMMWGGAQEEEEEDEDEAQQQLEQQQQQQQQAAKEWRKGTWKRYHDGAGRMVWIHSITGTRTNVDPTV